MSNNIKFQVAEEIYLEKDSNYTVPMYPMYEKLFEIDSSDDLRKELKKYYNDEAMTVEQCEDRDGLIFICNGVNGEHLIKVIQSDLYDEFINSIT